MSAAANLSPVVGGVSPTVNGGVYELKGAVLQVERSLIGGASRSEEVLERARCEIGRVIHLAETLRRQLPDPHGLRAGNAVRRLLKALSLYLRLTLRPAALPALAAMLEVSVPDVRVICERGRARGWVRAVEVVGEDERWALTDEGLGFIGASEETAG